MSKRKRNPRVVAVEQMRDMKRHLEGALARWAHVGRQMYIPAADRKPGDNAYMRPREAHEYPETQPAYWEDLFVRMDQLARVATEVRELARTEYHRLKNG